MQTQARVIGAGKMFFDKFLPDTETPTGERYFGNTPAASTTATYQNLPHYTSDFAVQVQDEDFQLRIDRAVNFTCDNISSENVAVQFGTDPVPETTAPATAATETILNTKLGYFYQLGVTAAQPAGVGTIANLVVHVGSTLITATTNYTVDLDRGRVYLLPNAATILDGDDVIFAYDKVSQTRTLIVDEGIQIEGALRFIADNRKGPNKDYFWPRVKLSPTGEYQLKGDTWMQLTYVATVLHPSDGRKRVYATDVLGG